MNTELLFAALNEAERLIEEGWANEHDAPVIYRHDEADSSREIDVTVWVMMHAISTGIGMKSKWDREKDG